MITRPVTSKAGKMPMFKLLITNKEFELTQNDETAHIYARPDSSKLCSRRIKATPNLKDTNSVRDLRLVVNDEIFRVELGKNL